MIILRALNPSDGQDVFTMLKEIKQRENSFTNPVNEMTYDQFKQWLVQQDKWSKGEDLPEGYVGQSIFWLYDEHVPIGIGKIRHGLTAASRNSGGNIGYAIRPQYRGNGYGKELLRLLLAEAKKMKIDELLLTVDKGNPVSRRIIEDNGGILIKVTWPQ